MTHIDLQIDPSKVTPRLNDWLGDWLHDPEQLHRMAELIGTTDLAAHADEVKAAARSNRGRKMQGSVQVIDVRGTLMKSESSFGGTSTVALRREVRQAAADPDVGAILLNIESPGGTAAGTPELAADVAAAAKRKRVIAYIEDLGASAAYWIASQANEVYINETGRAGSIGTFTVVQDASGMAAARGVKVHVVRAGKFKGMGTPGAEITADQLAVIQGRIDEINEFFLAGVAKGRKMSLERVRDLADGRAHIGSKAVEMGLVDGVRTFDEVLSELIDRSQENMAATIKEIKAACPGIDNDFAVGLLEREVTTEQAKDAWMQEQQLRLEASQEEAKKMQQKLAESEKAASEATGVDGLSTKEQSSSTAGGDIKADVRERWDAAIEAAMKSGKSRMQAVSHVVRTNKQLHAEFLEATNAAK